VYVHGISVGGTSGTYSADAGFPFMAALRAHGLDVSHGSCRLSGKQVLWLKDAASGAALVVFIASVLAVL